MFNGKLAVLRVFCYGITCKWVCPVKIELLLSSLYIDVYDVVAYLYNRPMNIYSPVQTVTREMYNTELSSFFFIVSFIYM